MTGSVAIAGVVVSVVLFIGIVTGLVLYGLAQQRRHKRELAATAAALGARSSGSVYAGELAGTAYRYWRIEAGKNRPPSFHVSIDCATDGEFRLVRETGALRLFKRLGVSAEVQTGDRAFDQAVYVLSDTPAFTRSALLDARRREAVQRLQGLGFTEVVLAAGRLEARIRPLRDPAHGSPEVVEEAVRQLGVLGQGLERLQATATPDAGWKARRLAVYAFSIGTAIGGLATVMWGVNAFRPLDGLQVFLDSLRLGLAALLAFGMLALMWLRGRSSSHIHLSVTLGVSLIGIPALAAGGLLVLNGLLDDGPASEHGAPVLHKRWSRSKSSTTYYATVKSWRAGRRAEEIRIDHSTYQRASPGRSRLVVATSAGRFGYEWVADYRLE